MPTLNIQTPDGKTLAVPFTGPPPSNDDVRAIISDYETQHAPARAASGGSSTPAPPAGPPVSAASPMAEKVMARAMSQRFLAQQQADIAHDQSLAGQVQNAGRAIMSGVQDADIEGNLAHIAQTAGTAARSAYNKAPALGGAVGLLAAQNPTTKKLVGNAFEDAGQIVGGIPAATYGAVKTTYQASQVMPHLYGAAALAAVGQKRAAKQSVATAKSNALAVGNAAYQAVGGDNTRKVLAEASGAAQDLAHGNTASAAAKAKDAGGKVLGTIAEHPVSTALTVLTAGQAAAALRLRALEGAALTGAAAAKGLESVGARGAAQSVRSAAVTADMKAAAARAAQGKLPPNTNVPRPGDTMLTPPAPTVRALPASAAAGGVQGALHAVGQTEPMVVPPSPAPAAQALQEGRVAARMVKPVAPATPPAPHEIATQALKQAVGPVQGTPTAAQGADRQKGAAKPIPVTIPTEGAAVKPVPVQGTAVSSSVNPVVPAPAIRDAQSFAANAQAAFGLPADQAKAAASLVDARADAWAKQTGRPKSDYYTTRFAGIEKGGEPGAGALYQAGSGIGYNSDGSKRISGGARAATQNEVAATSSGEPVGAASAADDSAGTGRGQQGAFSPSSVAVDPAIAQKVSKELERQAHFTGTPTQSLTYILDNPRMAHQGLSSIFIARDGRVHVLKPHTHEEVSRLVLRKAAGSTLPNNASFAPELTKLTGGTIHAQAYDNGVGVNIDLSHPPTQHQINAIRDLYYSTNGEDFFAQFLRDGQPLEKFSTSLQDMVDTINQDRTTPIFQGNKASVAFLNDGRAVIHALEKPDISSVVHELGHVFRRDLEGDDLAAVEQWAGVKNGEWKTEHEEKFARGFERYLHDGQAPTPKLATVFGHFKAWLTNIYHTIKGGPIDVQITPQVRQVMDRLFKSDQEAAPAVSGMKPTPAAATVKTAPAPAVPAAAEGVALAAKKKGADYAGSINLDRINTDAAGKDTIRKTVVELGLDKLPPTTQAQIVGDARGLGVTHDVLRGLEPGKHPGNVQGDVWDTSVRMLFHDDLDKVKAAEAAYKANPTAETKAALDTASQNFALTAKHNNALANMAGRRLSIRNITSDPFAATRTGDLFRQAPEMTAANKVFRTRRPKPADVLKADFGANNQVFAKADADAALARIKSRFKSAADAADCAT